MTPDWWERYQQVWDRKAEVVFVCGQCGATHSVLGSSKQRPVLKCVLCEEEGK